MSAPETTQPQTQTQQPKAHLIGYLAEQPLHPGTGQALGAIDQPVAREGGSNIPVIPGSSHKGSIKHAVTGGSDKSEFWSLFGATDNEGGVLFSDIRLILLPIRSSVGSYKWATCPYLLERLARDLKRTGSSIEIPVPAVPDGKVLTAIRAGDKKKGGEGEKDKDASAKRLYLEELTFEIAADDETAKKQFENVTAALATFIPDDDPKAGAKPYTNVKARLRNQLLIMSDDDFAWFARYGLPIYARNKLKERTKSSENLWYEEHLPADTLMYGIVAPGADVQGGKTLTDLLGELTKLQYLQIGGDETVGRGFCRLHVVKGA